MRITCFILLNLIAVVLHGQQYSFDEQLKQIITSEKQAYAGKLVLPSVVQITDYDVSYYRCEWAVDPAVNFIQGKITIYFKPLTSAFDSVLLNLTNVLTTDSVNYHNSAIAFTHSNNLITAVLPSAILLNTKDSISVYYHGTPSGSGFGSFVQSTHNGSPIIWTLSEPYGASDWWPCKNGLTDKADSLDVIITTPKAYTAASNGLLIDEKINGPVKLYHWRHRYPIATYLICMAVTNYARYSHTVPFGANNLPVLNFVYPEDSATAASKTPDIIPVMQLYDSLFGIYAFANEKYGHAQFGWGGGMEHQTMTFVTSFDHELIAHELAHHWFGDKVTCASWHDIWLNESFATYLSGLTYEHMFNGVYWMSFKKGRIDNITSQPGGSVWCDDTTTVNRIFDGRLSYNKGAMVLHQLRWVIGDSAFFASVNNYLSDSKLAYGFAHTSDLQSHFETAVGQSLNWYFSDWFTGQGYPSYTITWNQNGSSVNITITQTQSHPSVSFFELPIPIELKGAGHDTIVRLNNTFSGQQFTVTIPFTVDSVFFDPKLWLITAHNDVASVFERNMNHACYIFPNPMHNKLKIKFIKEFSDMKVQLVDINGKEVKTVQADGLKAIDIDLDGISHGIYFVHFTSGKTSSAQKIIIQ